MHLEAPMLKSSILCAALLSTVACGAVERDKPAPDAQHDSRFVGLWAVEYPTNAQFVATFYEFGSDGTLAVSGSNINDCSWVSSEQCVTGSVSNCTQNTSSSCAQSTSCVFGNEWHSLSSTRLVIMGTCSDGQIREILLGFNEDSSSNSAPNGAMATLLSVDNETDWMFPPIDPLFRKCPDGIDESACAAELAPY